MSTTSSASAIFRPLRVQWLWNSAIDPWSLDRERWQNYNDVENEIIEDGYNQKKTQVEIDGDYVIDLEFWLQYNKVDHSNVRQVKRVELDIHLRKERFSLPITLATTRSNQEQKWDSNELSTVRNYGEFSAAYYELEVAGKNKTFADVVDEAVRGILQEGAVHHKTKEAEKLVKSLLAVKHFGTSVNAEHGRIRAKVPTYIGQQCALLYTKDSFLFKLINQVLRDPQTVTREQIQTLGPFCYLLQTYLRSIYTSNIQTVYRGVNLDDEQRQQYRKKDVKFTAFTSTTTDRALAEIYGNTLLIMDLEGEMDGVTYYPAAGADISSFSNFPQEKEFLLWPRTWFQINGYEYDNETKKYLIYLKIQGGG
jgi:hypothetical protein